MTSWQYWTDQLKELVTAAGGVEKLTQMVNESIARAYGVTVDEMRETLDRDAALERRQGND